MGSNKRDAELVGTVPARAASVDRDLLAMPRDLRAVPAPRKRSVATADPGDADLIAYGWPPLLCTRRAISYTGQSRNAIGRAVRSGELVPVGKRGRSFVFRRLDLDSWLVGGHVQHEGELATVIPIERARAPLSESLKRVRAAVGREDK